MIRYSVIYVNYHSSTLIRNSVDSMLAHHDRSRVEFLIASNSQGDLPDLETWICQTDARVRLIPMPENLGFAAANNAAAAQAIGEYLFFFNPDTLVEMPVLDGLAQVWNALPDPGMVGPLTRYEDGAPQRTVRNQYQPLHTIEYLVPFASRLFSGFPDHRVPDRSQAVEVVNGSAMFLHREVFAAIGGMESRYFLYWEEDDLCEKLRKLGRTVWFAREVEVTHLESRVATRADLALQRIRYESKYAYLGIHHPEWIRRDLLISIPVFAIRLLISVVTVSPFRIRLNDMLLRWHVARLFGRDSGS